MKQFRHQFKNGLTIVLECDLSEATPSFKSNMKLDAAPLEVLDEYRVWLNTVILPELVASCSDLQLINLAAIGKSLIKK